MFVWVDEIYSVTQYNTHYFSVGPKGLPPLVPVDHLTTGGRMHTAPPNVTVSRNSSVSTVDNHQSKSKSLWNDDRVFHVPLVSGLLIFSNVDGHSHHGWWELKHGGDSFQNISLYLCGKVLDDGPTSGRITEVYVRCQERTIHRQLF